jgi:hypothetical protein
MHINFATPRFHEMMNDLHSLIAQVTFIVFKNIKSQEYQA